VTPSSGDDVLLDTHALHWWLNEPGRLSGPAAAAIDDARTALVSPISMWEMGMLTKKGRLVVSDAPLPAWLRALRDHPKVAITPLAAEIALDAGLIDGLDGDPADRLLVATARAYRVPLVTKDSRLHDFAKATRFIATLW